MFSEKHVRLFSETRTRIYENTYVFFEKDVHVFPETRTCFFKKTYVFIFKSVSLPQEMGKEPSLSY